MLKTTRPAQRAHHPFRGYRRLCMMWAAVFALLGLACVIIPEQSGSWLDRLAHALGLRGEIVADAGSLFHVLAASLMSVLVLLALVTAIVPAAATPYYALLLSKLVSTVGFAYLALNASAWLLCALADGFVALTLYLARRRAMCPVASEPFVSRYLSHMGVGSDGIAQYHQRLAEYPTLLRILAKLAACGIDRLAPALTLQRFCRATHLPPADFARLCATLHPHPWPVARAAWLLVNFPGLWVLAKRHEKNDV
jgi:hypothetical protein